MTSLQIGHYVERSDIYGPGTRFVIWVQGCSLACQGCWNKQFWSSLGGKSISVSTLLDEIDQSGVDGVTSLGFTLPTSVSLLAISSCTLVI